MLDIKQIDDDMHRVLTGHTNTNILRMAQVLSDLNKPVWIRHVLVPGGSDNDDCLHRLADFIHTLHNVERVEVLRITRSVHLNGKAWAFRIRLQA